MGSFTLSTERKSGLPVSDYFSIQVFTFINSPRVDTDGVFADFFTVAVRTGGPGMNGISLLLIERTMPGVATRHMQCSGVWASGTSYVTFEDVKVPVENIIGKENKGFKAIMVKHPRIVC